MEYIGHKIKPISRFEAGRWYVYLGHNRLGSWNPRGCMDFVLDNRPHKCRAALHKGEADFLDHPRAYGGCWSWGDGFENWREIVDYKGDKMDRHEALERLAAIEAETARLRKIIGAGAETPDPRLAWIGKWGFCDDYDPECPDGGRLRRLEGIDPGNDAGDFRFCADLHWRYFRPATPEELGTGVEAAK